MPRYYAPSEAFVNHVVNVIAEVIEVAEIVHKAAWDRGVDMYEWCMLDELWRRGLKASRNQEIKVYNGTKHICTFVSDMLVDEWLVLEIKGSNDIVLEDNYERQLVHFLTLTGVPIALKLDFCDYEHLEVSGIYKGKPYTKEDVFPLKFTPSANRH